MEEEDQRGMTQGQCMADKFSKHPVEYGMPLVSTNAFSSAYQLSLKEEKVCYVYFAIIKKENFF